MRFSFLIAVFTIVCALSGNAQVKILFDATKAESASNADWVIDADQHNLDWYSPIGVNTGGNESNAQRIPTPAQSGITSSTPETYWAGSLSSWGIDCVKQGYNVETLPYGGRITYHDGTNAQDLSNYKVFIIDEPNIRFTTAEQSAILQFVNNGGGLFMISDHDQSDRNSDGWDSPGIWNDLMSNNSNPFGITFDLLNISPHPTNIPVPTNDSIRNGPYGGVTQVQFSNGTSMTLNTTANPTVQGKIYTTSNGSGNTNCIFAIAHYGLGKVAALSDSSPTDDGTGDPNDLNLYNGWTQDAAGNHEKLIMNATIWLASSPAVAPPVIQISGASNICRGQSTTLTASGATSYVWQPGGQTTASITVSPTTTTMYHVTGTNSGGSTTDSITVTVGQLPVASFTASVNNNTVTVNNTSTNQSSCLWTWGDGNTSSTCSPSTYTYSAAGTYTIQLKVSNNCGSDSVTHNVTIAPVINLHVSGNNNICQGQSTTLTASGATSYLWQPGGQTTASITVSPTTTTTYHVTGTTLGTSVTDSITVVVGSVPEAAFSNVINANTVTFNNTSSGSSSCIWYWGNGAPNYNGCNPPPQYYPAGTDTVMLITTNTCGTDSFITILNVIANLPNVTINGRRHNCPGQSDTLTASGANSYIWQPGNVSGATLIVSPTVSTTYYVTGTAAGGSATDSITVIADSVAFAAFTDTIQGDTLSVANGSTGDTACVWIWGDGTSYIGCNPPPHVYDTGQYYLHLAISGYCGTDTIIRSIYIAPTHVGISNIDGQSQIRIFPVPTTDMLNVQLPANDWAGSIQIFDVPGKMIRSIKMEGPLNKISTDMLPQGSYVGRAVTANSCYTFRFVKQ